MTPLSGPTPMPEGTPADNPYGFYCYEFDKRKHLERLLAEAVGALEEAIEDVEDWSGYATEYFQKKHNLEGCLKGHREALSRIKAAKEQI